jgi:hypothetical protein
MGRNTRRSFVTAEDKHEIRAIMREELGDLVMDVGILKDDMVQVKAETRRNSILLEAQDHRISAIAENVSTSMENSRRMNNLDERLIVVEHLNGIGV